MFHHEESRPRLGLYTVPRYKKNSRARYKQNVPGLVTNNKCTWPSPGPWYKLRRTNLFLTKNLNSCCGRTPPSDSGACKSLQPQIRYHSFLDRWPNLNLYVENVKFLGFAGTTLLPNYRCKYTILYVAPRSAYSLKSPVKLDSLLLSP
jgi:hypothetical protein